MDEELSRLCGEVGDLFPSWETDEYWETGINGVGEITTHKWSAKRFSTCTYVPVFTSDYLLEKLPDYIWIKHSELWIANFGTIHVSSDTPLKALLKLTLALHTAGELK